MGTREIVMSETELRNALDKTVDAVIKKLDKKTFLEAMPKTIDQEFLASMHMRLQTVVRQKLVEDKIAEEQIGDKLVSLDKIVAATPHPTSHRAWRPVVGVDSLGVGAQDLKVSLDEKEELGLVLQQLNSEVEQLETKITEEGNRMTRNMNEITNTEKSLDKFASKLGEM